MIDEFSQNFVGSFSSGYRTVQEYTYPGYRCSINERMWA